MVLKRRKKTVHVKQKIKPPKLWKKPKYHKFDDQVKKNWAIKSSTAKNYSTFGISTDPNKTISRALKKQNSPFSFISREEAGEALPEKQTAVTQKHVPLTVPENDDSRKVKTHLSRLEIKYLQNLLDKYGEDYGAMARDIKLNFYQHTKTQLKKKIKVYFDRYFCTRKDGLGFLAWATKAKDDEEVNSILDTMVKEKETDSETE